LATQGVDSRNWLPAKKVLISSHWISGVGWADVEVYADLGLIEILETPASAGRSVLNRSG
jgi:hypothetical protein